MLRWQESNWQAQKHITEPSEKITSIIKLVKKEQSVERKNQWGENTSWSERYGGPNGTKGHKIWSALPVRRYTKGTKWWGGEIWEKPKAQEKMDHCWHNYTLETAKPCLFYYADSFCEKCSLKTTQKFQSYMYIMVVDIDLLKYPFSAHSQPIRVILKRVQVSLIIHWFDLTGVSSLTFIWPKAQII